MVAARKDRDTARTLLFSTLLADIGNREIELAHDLVDAEVIEVVQRAIKRRRESVEQYTKGGRQDLADREAFEITQLEGYLPPQAAEGDIRAAVQAAVAEGAANLGAVMGKVMPQFKGRADGALVNRIAREVLAG
jgi:uncharacterized protein